LGAIKILQEAGKIRHVGLSEVKTGQIEEARRVIEIVSVQNKYNIVDRAHEDVVEYCTRNGIGFIPWFPVAAGALARSGGKLGNAAKSCGMTSSQLSLAWLLHRSPVILPIPGTSSLAHLEENMRASDIVLTDEEWAVIEEDIVKK
jgi:aryl-alcohol dehydrogenase-like predicted oxidoreductase